MSSSGFIIASIHQKAVKQALGLESQIIRYTPVLGNDLESIVEQFQKAFPDHIVVMTMPVDILKKNIEVLESLDRQKEKNIAL